MAETTLYDILELSPGAASDEIKAAYRQLSTQVHPDRGGSNALFRLVREAFEVLSDEKRRQEYDRSRRVTDLTQPTGSAGGDGGPDEVKALADHTVALKKSLLEFKATATTDRDHLAVFRLQLELAMAQIAWNMALFRQLSGEGKMEVAVRFQAKASEVEKSVPAIERLISRTEGLIAENARSLQSGGSANVKMIACGLCGARNRVSPGTTSFSCGSCHNKHVMVNCDGCGTPTYLGTDPNGSATTFVCETCDTTKRERRRGERRGERRKGDRRS
jgi:curved DNA-binding protein CbpA